MKKIILLSIMLVILSVPVFSQTTIKDSLLQELTTVKNDTDKVILLNNIGKEMFYEYNMKEAYNYYNSSLTLSQEIAYYKGEAAAYSNISMIYSQKNDFDSCEYYVNKSLKINESNNLQNQLANNYIILGTTNDLKGNYDTAFYYYKKALSIKEDFNDEEGVATINMNIGILFYFKGDYKLSEEYYLKAIGGFKMLDNLTAVYENIGVLMSSQARYEKALFYYLKSLQLAEELNNKKGIVNIKGKIGGIYFKQKDYHEARKIYEEVIEISLELENKSSLVSTNMNIAGIYIEQENYKQAEPYLNKGLSISKEIDHLHTILLFQIYLSKVYLKTERVKKAEDLLNLIKTDVLQLKNIHVDIEFELISGEIETYNKNYKKANEHYMIALEIGSNTADLHNIRTAYFRLYKNAKKAKNYKEAVSFGEKHSAYNDSITSKINKGKILDMQAKYEVAEKEIKIIEQEKEIQLQQAENKINKRTIFGITAIAILLFIGAIIYYFQKQKTQKQKYEKQLLQKQVETQDAIEQELASELHSGMGSELASIILNLENKNTDNNLSEEIGRIKMHYKTIRSKSHLLSIPNFIQTTIEEEINDVATTFRTKNQSINCNIFSKNGWADIHPIIQQSIYRITQELFTNTTKHANATEIDFQLTRHQEYISLMYEDNGSGYNPDEIKQNMGYKKEIKDRINYIKGNFTDDSKKNKGANLSFNFPINYEK